MKTFLCRPAVDRDVSYTVSSQGCEQLFLQASISFDVPNFTKQPEIDKWSYWLQKQYIQPHKIYNCLIAKFCSNLSSLGITENDFLPLSVTWLHTGFVVLFAEKRGEERLYWSILSPDFYFCLISAWSSLFFWQFLPAPKVFLSPQKRIRFDYVRLGFDILCFWPLVTQGLRLSCVSQGHIPACPVIAWSMCNFLQQSLINIQCSETFNTHIQHECFTGKRIISIRTIHKIQSCERPQTKMLPAYIG